MSDLMVKNNNIKVKENENLTINDLIKGLTESQTVLNYALAGFKTETEQKFNEVHDKLDEHDILIKRKIQLAPNEAKILRDKVKEKVKQICSDNNLDYHKCKSKIFPRVYKVINDKNQVASYRELPSFYFKEIIEELEVIDVNVKDIVNEVA